MSGYDDYEDVALHLEFYRQCDCCDAITDYWRCPDCEGCIHCCDCNPHEESEMTA